MPPLQIITGALVLAVWLERFCSKPGRIRRRKHGQTRILKEVELPTVPLTKILAALKISAVEDNHPKNTRVYPCFFFVIRGEFCVCLL
jgi:hypothetical protein